VGWRVLNNLAVCARSEAETGLKGPGEMALISKSHRCGNVGQTFRPSQSIPGCPAPACKQMGMGRQSCMLCDDPGQMPGGEAREPGQIVQRRIVGEFFCQQFEDEPHGLGFPADWRGGRVIIGIAGNPDGQQGEQTCFPGQRRCARIHEQPMCPGDTGGQAGIVENALAEVWELASWQHLPENRDRQVEHPIAPTLGDAGSAVMRDVRLDQIDRASCGHQRVSPVMKRQRTSLNDAEGISFMRMASESLCLITGR